MDITELQNELDRIILERGQAAFGTDVVIRYADHSLDHTESVDYFNGRVNIIPKRNSNTEIIRALKIVNDFCHNHPGCGKCPLGGIEGRCSMGGVDFKREIAFLEAKND